MCPLGDLMALLSLGAHLPPGCLGLLNPGVRWCAATLWPQEGTVGAHSPGFNTRSLLNESGHDSN